MAGAFDAFRYISYMRLRWRWIAVSCLTATSLAIVVSLLLPREYTATARIVIEPPAGTDLRAAVAVSPIYLESLKTYEQFADSDSLFRTAVDRFALASAWHLTPAAIAARATALLGPVRGVPGIVVQPATGGPR